MRQLVVSPVRGWMRFVLAMVLALAGALVLASPAAAMAVTSPEAVPSPGFDHLDAAGSNYDFRPEIARPPPGGTVSDVYDLTDPAADGGRILRAFSGLEVQRSAPSSAVRFGSHSADDLAHAASIAGMGDYTAAGHALTKHAGGQRAGGSAFPALSGNPANINRIAQSQVDDILSNGRVVTRTHPNHGPIVEVFAPDGRGARWYADGRFFGFLEP